MMSEAERYIVIRSRKKRKKNNAVSFTHNIQKTITKANHICLRTLQVKYRYAPSERM